MFRPPEYAALINPAIGANFIVHTKAMARYLEAQRQGTLMQAQVALELERFSKMLFRCGPKDWSPIGEYKFEADE